MADEAVAHILQEWGFSNHTATFRSMLAFYVQPVCLFASV
jgi:hypothetical protein